jgi:hypothetical protein
MFLFILGEKRRKIKHACPGSMIFAVNITGQLKSVFTKKSADQVNLYTCPPSPAVTRSPHIEVLQDYIFLD